MDKPIVELKHITVDFKNKKTDVVAVKDVSLTVERGDVFGIVGYSGAGKSTLVRVINLLQRPTKGIVNVNSDDLLALNIPELRRRRKKIGMIFQHFNLMNSRTVMQNVAFALHGTSLSKAKKAEKVAHLLELVGLTDKKDAYPRQLSGGQKQRVGIARALANDPDILISDEGTSALDPKTTESILNLLAELNQKYHLTIILITHQMEAVKQICHHVAVMDNGRIIEQGSLLQIFTQPKTALTKSFIDTTTRLKATLKTIYQQENVINLPASDALVRLSYLGAATSEPMISTLYARFQVTANILYGNVENLQKTPIGNLIVILSGTKEHVTAAIDYLGKSGVQIKQLKPQKLDGGNA